MAVTLTEKAAKEIKKVMEEQKLQESYLRIGVRGGGCAGFSYALAFDENFNETTDKLSEQNGVKLVVDKKSDLYIDGTTIDFHEDINKRGFTFDNPNAVKSCGCNKSFST